jgi:hypothetical protein
MTKTFELGDVLSITTGHLVSRRHIDGIYDILNYMTGDNLFTHQLPRAMDECKPFLLAQHPELADVTVADVHGRDEVYAWLDKQEAKFGALIDVEPVPTEDHTYIDPISELRMMRPDAEIISVVAGGEDD